eukprot:CAMPEP_0202893016 /NCGR_PEP_ID=MMETSP1392-20130828/2670_1 /ASSEMBLY_ACC=CAM_ASM_000868 /TAXON_ID=225041 /ORGANISM="Chlamydomonas chlamydogama, Strain SAG 11-48b" /LENGTH=46 /DNA_ID= /DNA_START= /DNA_END= /DNA_ORIENTATION=
MRQPEQEACSLSEQAVTVQQQEEPPGLAAMTGRLKSRQQMVIYTWV